MFGRKRRVHEKSKKLLFGGTITLLTEKSKVVGRIVFGE